MGESDKCPQCGAEIPAGVSACPVCLLKRGLESNTAGYTTEPPPSGRWTPPSVEELSGRFGELEIRRLIGRGGMGAVYEARQKNLDRVVALKILPAEMAHDAAFAERFAREAQAMAKLNHPHIVTIHEFGQRDGWFYFLMEYMDGLSLRGVLDRGHISPKEALAIVPQICEALQYAHDQGIVHRDIKPENILLNKQGQVKIADFGLAKLMGGRAAAREMVMGTPRYMAPEQVEHPAEVDHRADIYSLGVVFYQLLTGELPVGKFEPPSKKVLVDVRLDEVVLRAMEREPSRRYQQASEVKTEVETILRTTAGGTLQVNDAPVFTETSLRGFLARWRGIVALLLGGITFTSPLAVRLTNISAIGFVGLIACLGYFAPLFPPLEVCFAFGAFFAFFGLIGIVAIIEFPAARRRAKRRRAAVPPGGTRFSRTAIIGLVWLAFVPIALVQRFLEARGVIAPAESWVPSNGKALWLVQRLAPVLGNSAFLGATVLGVIAIVQIRSSAGRLVGLGIALFDALAFALLIIDIFVVVGWLAGLREAAGIFGGPGYWPPPVTVLWVFLAGVTCTTVDGVIFHWARRWVNRQRGCLPVGPLAEVRGPAIGLMVTAILNWVTIPYLTVMLLPYGVRETNLTFPGLVAIPLAALLLSSFTMYAALKMMRLESYRAARVASALAIIVTPGNIIGMPIGVWSLVVLARKQVRDVFAIRPWSKVAGGVALVSMLVFVSAGICAGRLARLVDSPSAVISETIGFEVGKQLKEAGASYADISVPVAEERDSATPFGVNYRGLRNFTSADGTHFSNASGEFIMSYIGGGQWQGSLGGTVFTVSVGKADDIDLPFVDDPQVLGRWQSVDFVVNPERFDPQNPNWKGELCFKDLTFLPGGKTLQSWLTWTKGVVIHHGDKTASKYEIREIGGQQYMFMEWKSGDVTILGHKPDDYVLRWMGAAATRPAGGLKSAR